jgi:putative phage-type endonuclease
MIIHNMEQRSNAWYQIRLGRFTGTRIGALLSAKTTAKYQDSVFDVITEILTNDFEENYISEDMQHGIDTEPEAAKEYESIFGIETKEVGFITPENKYAEWVGISPDRLVENGLLEIKCPKAKTHIKYIADNRFPKIYEPQVQAQLWVTGFDYCDFMSYVPKLKPFIVRVYPDKEYHKKLEFELDIAIGTVREYLKIYKNYDYLS